MEVVFYEPALERLLKSPRSPVGKDLKRRGRLVEAAAKKQAGRRTGALRASIHMRHFVDPRGQYVQVGSDLNYALMHHDGTLPHKILPKNGTYLVFTSRGRLVKALSVNHPGTKPNRYLLDNLVKALIP